MFKYPEFKGSDEALIKVTKGLEGEERNIIADCLDMGPFFLSVFMSWVFRETSRGTGPRRRGLRSFIQNSSK